MAIDVVLVHEHQVIPITQKTSSTSNTCSPFSLSLNPFSCEDDDKENVKAADVPEEEAVDVEASEAVLSRSEPSSIAEHHQEWSRKEDTT